MMIAEDRSASTTRPAGAFQIVEEALRPRDARHRDDRRRPRHAAAPLPHGSTSRGTAGVRVTAERLRHAPARRQRPRVDDDDVRRRAARRRAASVVSGSRSRPAGSTRSSRLRARVTTRSTSRARPRCWNPSSSTWTVAPNRRSASAPASARSARDEHADAVAAPRASISGSSPARADRRATRAPSLTTTTPRLRDRRGRSRA